MNPKPEAMPRSVGSCLLVGAALLVIIKTFSILSPILLSLLLILLISIAVNPLICRMRALAGGRKRATGLIAAALITVMALTGLAFFGPMKASCARLSEQLPRYWDRLQKPLIRMEKRSVLSEERLQAEVTTEMAQAATVAGQPNATPPSAAPAPPPKPTESASLRSGLSQVLKDTAGHLTAVAFNAGQILFVLLTVIFGVAFTLMNPRPVFGAMFSLVPERHHAQALTIMQRIGKFVPGWAGATLLGMLTIALLVFVLMWPIFGFMDAMVLGLIAGILESLPYIGPVLSAVPAVLFAVGKGGMTPLWVVLAYVGVQFLENNIILPLLMARTMKLHPLAVLFSMLLCVAAFGVLGVLVAAPLVAVVDILHDELYRKRFLPTTTDADLDRMARNALHEKRSVPK